MKKLIELEQLLQFNNEHYFGNVHYCSINGKKYNFIKGYLTYNPRKFENSLYGLNVNSSATYLIRELNTGDTYVGSSGKIYIRLSKQKAMINEKNHSNANFNKLLETTNIKNFELLVFFTNNREEAFGLEQYFVDRFLNTSFLLNIARDVRFYTSPNFNRLGSKNSPEQTKRLADLARNRVFTDEDREKLSFIRRTNEKSIDQFKKVLEDKRRRISVDDVEYESLTEAGINSPYSESSLRRTLSRGVNKNIFYITDNESPLKGRTIPDWHKQRLSEVRKTNPAFIDQLSSVRDLTKKKIQINGIMYGSITEAIKLTGISESVIHRKLKESNGKENNEFYVLNYVKPQLKKVVIDGVVYNSVSEAAEILGLNKYLLKSRVKSGKIKYL